MRLVLALSLLFVVPLAHAEAFTLTGILMAIGEYASVVIAVASYAYGQYQQRKMEQDAKDAFNASLRDRLATQVATEAPYVTVYGTTKVGSNIVAMFTTGDKDQYKHLVCVFANHECEAIEEIYIAGKAVGPLSADGYVTSGPYYSEKTVVTYVQEFNPDTGLQENKPIFTPTPTDYVRVRKHLGTAGDPADADLMAAMPGSWTENHTLPGFCYIYLRIDLNVPDFQNGVPTVQARIRGKKLYDFRTGVTAYSENPALVIYDYLTGPSCNVSASRLPMAKYIAAANACDQVVSINGANGALYAINGTVTSDMDQSNVLSMMEQAMAGTISSTTWAINAGVYTAPIMTLDQSDIIGKLSVVAGTDDASLINGVKGTFIGPENDYVNTDFPPFQNAAFLTADGRELFGNVSFPLTDNSHRIHNLCSVLTEDLRYGRTFVAEFSYKAWMLDVSDRFYFNSANLGCVNKVVIVKGKKFTPNGLVELTLKEDDPSIWDQVDAPAVNPLPGVVLDDPYAVNVVTGLACSSGTTDLLVMADGTIVSRIHATWAQSTTASIRAHGEIQLEWQKTGDTAWHRASVEGDKTDCYLSPVLDGALYVVRIRAVNPANNAASQWTYATHRVIGKTAPPADVPWFTIEGNTLNWGSVADIDLAGYRIRFHYGLNRSWGDANPLHIGLITNGPYTPDTLPQGQITLMIKSVDTSGNESGTAAVIQTQFGDVLVENVVETVDFKALGYPGTLTSCSVVSGILKADTTSAFYGNDAANFYSDYDSLPFYIDAYSAMVYETPIFTPTKAAVDSKMTLNADMTGGAQFIEYRVSGANAMFPAVDTEPFYGDDTTPFYGPDAVYQPWPGQIAAQNLQYQFRFTIGQGATQGTIDTCNETIDVPDVSETLNNIVIAAAGTRLPLTKQYSFIKNVQLTLQDDGGTARTPIIIDKDATLGPLIKCKDASGAFVQGLIDAVPQGY